MKKKFLALAMALICTVSLAACGDSADQDKDKNDGNTVENNAGGDAENAGNQGGEDGNTGDNEGGEEVKSALPDSLENADLVIVWHTTEESWNNTLQENPNAFDLVWSTKAAFEEKYGGTVEVIGVGWAEQMGTVISKVNAGEVCDLVQAHDQNFPTYGAKNIVQDISQYIDLNDGFWYDSVTKAFTFNGKSYAAGADASPVVISYNKTLFQQYGQKTPREYFEEGNWTWDTFREVAMAMTGDTDGDGNNDIYGFDWWDSFYVQMLAANGVATINYGAPDGVVSNYTTPQAIETFTFLQDGYFTDKFIHVPNDDKFISDFKSGKLAMTCEYGFAAITAYECDYEIDWAPLPTGPSGQKYDCGGALTGFSIPVTSANPEGAAVFARMAYEMQHELNTSNNVAKYGQEDVDLMNTLASHIYFAPIGIEKFWDANWTLRSGMIEGTPVSTFATTADEQIREGATITLGQ
ncbi:MAG: extracellular solute-binding protein [Lachnospiraceae bacterium]|nr:extracellular solute-binding protein [Lachnospiraceae bacterium]